MTTHLPTGDVGFYVVLSDSANPKARPLQMFVPIRKGARFTAAEFAEGVGVLLKDGLASPRTPTDDSETFDTVKVEFVPQIFET